jgi:hemolysin III
VPSIEPRLGWLVVFAIRPLMAVIEPAGLWLLVAGGLCYTLGTIFYVKYEKVYGEKRV